MRKTRLKKNDNVKVMSGNSRGMTGKILFIDYTKGRVIVEGVNVISKHQKASQKSPQGGILKREAPITITNVMMICPQTNNPTRLGAQLITDEKTGKPQRMRPAKQPGEISIS